MRLSKKATARNPNFDDINPVLLDWENGLDVRGTDVLANGLDLFAKAPVRRLEKVHVLEVVLGVLHSDLHVEFRIRFEHKIRIVFIVREDGLHIGRAESV